MVSLRRIETICVTIATAAAGSGIVHLHVPALVGTLGMYADLGAGSLAVHHCWRHRHQHAETKPLSEPL